MTFQSIPAGRLPQHLSLAEHVIALIDALSACLAAHRRYRKLRAELLDYSPEQLAELAIRDADIEFVARAAARR
jgi:uncharacterized protein YjiS (DUF1127 family)